MSTPNKPPALLVFAGLDPSGGAGLVADIQTAAALRVHVLAVATTLTAQSLTTFDSFCAVDADMILAQARAAIRGFDVQAVKIGAIPSESALDAVASMIHTLRPAHVVVDPVRTTSSGGAMSRGLPTRTYLKSVLSMNPVLTPNRKELADLCAQNDPRGVEAGPLLAGGARAVLVTDGDGTGDVCTHRLITGDGSETFRHGRLAGSYRGSGCTLSTALAAQLMTGKTVSEAAGAALDFTFAALQKASLQIEGGAVRVPDRRVHS